MKQDSFINEQKLKIIKLIRCKKIEIAENELMKKIDSTGSKEELLNIFVNIFVKSNFIDEAIIVLEELIYRVPDDIHYFNFLAELYCKNQQIELSCKCLATFLNKNPENALACFNYAYYLKLNGSFESAIFYYKQSLKYKIEAPEEVHLNIATIYSDAMRKEKLAKDELISSLKINPNYIPAIYNMANLYEEEGDRTKALELFKKILEIDKKYYQALARIAELSELTEDNMWLIDDIKTSLQDKDLPPSTRLNLLYALGKILDESQCYEEAFSVYVQANQLNQLFLRKYEKLEIEKTIDLNTQIFSRNWFENLTTISDETPVFICGMFRSGSTLMEQILSANPKVKAGGELDFFNRLVHKKISPYPQRIKTITDKELKDFAIDYLNNLRIKFPDSDYITDKRPDNLMYLGLIKSLFPKAKIIYTVRAPIDNCLSIYFLRLGNGMEYSTNLLNIAHYYQQQQRLMSTWKTLFGDDIYEVQYDELVKNPEEIITGALNFLGLEWNESYLNFHKAKNNVKTASVWQVRKPLYSKSSGRWRNYKKQLKSLELLFNENNN